MQNVTIITHIVQMTYGDFIAAKKLIEESLVKNFDHIEWVLIIDRYDALTNPDYGYHKEINKFVASITRELSSFDESRITFYAISPRKWDVVIRDDLHSLAAQLAQRDLVVVFPTVLTTTNPGVYRALKNRNVNLIGMYEYGFNRYSPVTAIPTMNDLVNASIKQIFTGAPNQESASLIHWETIKPERSHEENEIKIAIEQTEKSSLPQPLLTLNDALKHTYPAQAPIYIRQNANSFYLFYLNYCGEPQLKPLDEETIEKYKLRDKQFYPATSEKIPMPRSESHAPLGVFKLSPPEYDRFKNTTLLNLESTDKKLYDYLFYEIEGTNQEKLVTYNASRTIFSSYTNSEVGNHDKDLAEHFYQCIIFALHNNPEIMHIDLLGKVNGEVIARLNRIITSEASKTPLPPELKIKVHNPYPLSHESMLILFNRAHSDKHPLLITGDQSFMEAVCLHATVIYQCPTWKRGYYDDVIALCMSNGLLRVADYLENTVLGEYYQNLSYSGSLWGAPPTKKLKSQNNIILDKNNPVFEEFERLAQLFPNLAEEFTKITRQLLQPGFSAAARPEKVTELILPKMQVVLSQLAHAATTYESTTYIKLKESEKEKLPQHRLK